MQKWWPPKLFPAALTHHHHTAPAHCSNDQDGCSVVLLPPLPRSTYPPPPPTAKLSEKILSQFFSMLFRQLTEANQPNISAIYAFRCETKQHAKKFVLHSSIFYPTHDFLWHGGREGVGFNTQKREVSSLF